MPGQKRMSRAVPLTAILSALVACGSERQLVHAKPVITAGFYVDSGGNAIGAATSDSATLAKVVSSNKVPVVAQDGHRVTWGEFRAATGTARLTCAEAGTRVHIDFQRLLPNGVYTGWLVFFQAPGFLSAGFDALTGLAPIGPSDGSQSKVIADGSGSAALDAVVPQGTVTVQLSSSAQSVPHCLLDAYEVHFVAAYHADGQTYGSVPGAPDKIAEQIGFMIAQGKVQTP